MTAKEYLRQIGDMEREITDKVRELEEVKAKAEGIRSLGIRETPGGSRSGDALSSAVIRIIELQEEIDRRVKAAAEAMTIIIKQIDGLKNQKSRMILRHRYVMCETWERIAEETGYTRQHCQRMEKQALKEFSAKYSRTIKNKKMWQNVTLRM